MSAGNHGSHDTPGLAALKTVDYANAKDMGLSTGDRVTKGAVNLPNGAIYEGNWLGEMRDGYGV